MTRVIVDSSTRAKLQNLTQRLELCDEAGNLLGFFSPAEDKEAYRRVKVPFTEEELQRFEREPGGRSLEEILRDLEKRR